MPHMLPGFMLAWFVVNSTIAPNLIKDPLVSGIKPLVADGFHGLTGTGTCQRSGLGRRGLIQRSNSNGCTSR
ncbi:uncharacterized protein LY79DRAFT_572149 [Colletotrichum navitas]|uniref:Uncharacterized protein n=1 Tax=Colletotrichum navitas TaxID=681940 RepID=A0AAD8PKU2_9PEZI|nr:uncharacterized protein LY79DRAFT_572149 [Colletotrichum navitas]KAK1566397.1 hypothetical protein LY79DRAFT_572149 [Colletotrichum navitas]